VNAILWLTLALRLLQESGQEFKDFQTEVMLIAPKEMPKVMQNKYATKTSSNPTSPEKQATPNRASSSGRNSAQQKKQVEVEVTAVLGKRTRNPSYKKAKLLAE